MNVSPRNAREAEGCPKGTVLRDFFPRSRAAVDVCGLLQLGLLWFGTGTTRVAVRCSFEVTVVIENSWPAIHHSHLGSCVQNRSDYSFSDHLLPSGP